MAQKKNITFDDIAKYTNFSKTTISRYFNNPDSLTLENQDIIADALIKLDYKENKVARILANGKTEFIGIIVPNLYLHYYSEMLNQILSTYETFDYKFLVFLGHEDPDTERKYIEELLSYKIEGMIILSHTIPSIELASLPIPIVAIEREDYYISSVNTDNYMGAYQASSLLASLDCDILFHINTPTSPETPAYGRIKGFTEFCKEQNRENKVFICDMNTTYDSTLSHINNIFEELESNYSGLKKGIFLSSDTYANVLLNLIFRKYGKLPEDYRIVGFDDSPVSRESVLPISTVGQQIDKIALEAVSTLVSQMEERKKRKPVLLKEPVHKVISPVLICRETTESI